MAKIRTMSYTRFGFRLVESLALVTFASLGLSAQTITFQGQSTSPLANAVVLVIRHAEKPESGEGLTPTGEARAKAYVGYFKSLKIDGKTFHIDHIFATADSKNSHRERLTVEPLGKALGLPLDLRYKNKGYGEMVKDIKSHSFGKGILICWHHGNIPSLVAEFGAPATLFSGGKWPSETFDWIVELKFDAKGELIPGETKTLHEHLMPSDKL